MPDEAQTSQNASASSPSVPPHGTEEPPTSFAGTLRRLGPGLIIAGSIVGSGELIATTKTGAQAGMTLLWLILIGCLIKVFVQIELGRYTISSGDTCLAGLNRLPGRIGPANWILWYWVILTLVSIAQLGGIVGGVGMSLAMSFPLTGDFVRYLQGTREFYTWDDKIWCVIITAPTILMLVRGRYNLVQSVAMALVATFTFLTIGNVIALQTTDNWNLHGDELLNGLLFHVPQGKGLVMALATFGIIGVGSTELVQYPYWCLEKGYARFAGPPSESAGWVRRARGWMMVMHYDAWLCMLVYTFATIAFYLLGACVLNRLPEGSGDPEGMRMVDTLARAYVPVFGEYARWLFLMGAIAVLYSTFFVANAGLARVGSDALAVFRVIAADDGIARNRAIGLLCVVCPSVSVAIHFLFPDPVTLVTIAGIMQSIMLPMLGAAALWFRFRMSDPRLEAGRVWDALLWLSCIGLLIAGTSAAGLSISKMLAGGAGGH
jgi:Mn2+/Fe2+ NRAMP family transporter